MLNVSCSRAGYKGATGGRGNLKKSKWRGCKGWVPDQQRLGTESEYQIADEIAPLIRSGQLGTGYYTRKANL
jgi:hypothetical protein